jgi:hypothetical protein
MSPNGPVALEVAPGVRLSVAVSAGSVEEAEGALPAIDVSAVPGARVVLRRGFASEAVVVRAACVTAPSDRWAPGLEELVLGRATGVGTAALGAAVERWEAGAIEQPAPGRFAQALVGRAAGREVARMQHTLGFVGEQHEVLLCTVACAERGSDAGRAGAAGVPACQELVGQAGVEGAFAGPPPPSALVRAVLFAAEQPYETAAGVAVVCVVVAAALLARRPRVPWRGAA